MKITIIIPVWNEQEKVNTAIAHIRTLPDGSAAEIVIVDGDPEGSTVKTVRDESVITATSAKGRACQMNRGAALASGDVLVFLHADTFLPADALRRIRAVMQDARNAAGAFQLGIDSNRAIFRVTEWYAALRTRLSRIPFGDQAIFLRRRHFAAIGGYSALPLMEDIDLMKRIRKRRGRIVIIPRKVKTSPRRWEQEGIVYCTLRNWALQICYALGVSPERIARWYR